MALIADCPQPKANENILPLLAKGDKSSLRRAGLEYARYVLAVDEAFAECNARFAALLEYYHTLNGE